MTEEQPTYPQVSETQRRQEHAIMQSARKRRNDLRPLREAVDDEINRIGWKIARPIVAECLSMPMIALRNQRAGWWSKVGKRNGSKLLEALKGATQNGPRLQQGLWPECTSTVAIQLALQEERTDLQSTAESSGSASQSRY